MAPMRFQSSAGFDPGRYAVAVVVVVLLMVFQSSAGFDPGRYLHLAQPGDQVSLVSILGRV